MNRKLISKAISDIDSSFIREAMLPPAAADQTPERTLKMGKYEKKRTMVSSRKLISLILAACLVFALALTAYAANWLGIREMFGSVGHELPQEAEPYIQTHTETAAAEDWNARVTETLCDSSRALVTVTVSGGDKYILAPTYVNADDSVNEIGRQDDLTLEEYAKEQGKELLFVGASLLRNEHLGFFTQSEAFENGSDGEIHILVDAKRSGGEEAGDAVCYVTGVTQSGEVLRLDVPFSFAQTPTEESGTYVPIDPNAVPGITVMDATVEKTPMGWTVRFTSRITDQEIFENIKFMAVKEFSYMEGGGFVLEDDGTWSTTFTMAQGDVSDSLTVHFFDWDGNNISDIIFEKAK